MKIAVLKERRPAEARVAASPDTVKKMVALGWQVTLEAGAGAGAAFTDQAYRDAGASVAADAAAALVGADVVLKVQRPLGAGEAGGPDEVALLKPGTVLIGLLAPFAGDHLQRYAAAGLTSLSMELVPRITRAQSMDVLSSQANLAGYKAVLDAATEFGRAFPMMMTAAGTIAPARVLVLGAGVAGLQAIATARRLGAIVSAFDVRAAAKEQVESLGASFIEVDAAAAREAETAGGYAREMNEDYRRRQADKIHEALKKQDVAICTALIPGRPAPRLITEAMVRDMKPGSVIVDLAAEQGGNCELSEHGQVVTRHGVRIVAHANVPSRIAVDASSLYARNLLAFLTPLVDKETKQLKLDRTDEIVKATLLTIGGAVVHEQFGGAAARPAAAATPSAA
ncbi:MAG TPA: Re/Si-specific NAD(P)(+) transhydrogenase subunit alpha [Candidatus Sulfotelmatobacter sp.]|nr:Re/Si-specific NAD(P)(+) transhydrogenase subunit alpha [Candidatus Sulfotelmatobacter sp.]